MDTTISPLVLTKLRIPALRKRVVARKRLVECFGQDRGKRFTLVCAPAGYGKTTLLIEWTQSLLQDGCAVAWYALDPGDDDGIPFGAYLVAGLAQALGLDSGLDSIAQRLRTSPEVDLSQVLQSVINAVMLSSRECVLVLDDYHLITSPAIHSAVTFLLEHLPENMRVVIGSRSDPPLPLARMRVRGHLLEIRMADLRFTEDETALFLNEVMGLDLTPQGVSVLEKRTEGWVAGLQLAALSLSGRSDRERFIESFAGSHRYLVEYLLEEVINRQPEEVRSFLLATSVLERMSAPLCDAILGEGTCSETILERLDQENLFMIALDEEGRWYRYHHLFRDFLLTRLHRQKPDCAVIWHRAASEWFAANHLLREAAQHALQTGDWEYAAAFVERHSFTMIVHGEISTIYEWCSAFPEEVMQMHPMLCILQCWALVLSFRRQNRPRVEQRLRQAGQAIARIEDQQLVGELEEHAAIVRTFLAMAPDPTVDPEALLTQSRDMLAAYPEGDAGRFSALLTGSYAHMALNDLQSAARILETARQTALNNGLYFGVVESTFHLSRVLYFQGHLRQSAEVCRQGRVELAAQLDHPEQALPALGGLDIALGCVLLEQDQLDQAEIRLLRGLELVGLGTTPYYLMTAYVALARLYEIRGRSEDALRYLNRLEETWPDIAFCTEGLRVSLTLRTAPADAAALADAAAWCNKYSGLLVDEMPSPGMGPFGAAEAFYLAQLARVRAQTALGNLEEAGAIIYRLLKPALANGLVNRVIELSLLEAHAAQVGQDDRRARSALERALAAAQPEGYLRVFDQGSSLTQLLARVAAAGVYRDYVGRILAATGAQDQAALRAPGRAAGNRSSSELGVIESLSERELEVLDLIAKGATNQAIAEQLVITVGTVKSHINHILRKLDAHNRTEAVARARKLGWIKI